MKRSVLAARTGLLTAGFAASWALAGAPIAVAAPGGPAGDVAVTAAHGVPAPQAGGCEKTRRPSCSKPGRRSTHK